METVVVVQWAAGYVSVSDGGSGARREIAWPAVDVKTAAAAAQIGAAVLATLGVRDSVSVSAQDTPVWPKVGDAHSVAGWSGAASTQRLVARRVGMDENGWAIVTPTFSSPEEEALSGQRRAIEAMTTGSVSRSAAGQSAQGRLASTVPTGALSPPTIPPWSVDPPAVGRGPGWTADESVVITVMDILCRETGPPDDPISIKLYVNGSSVATITFPKDETHWTVLGDLFVGAGSVLQFAVDSVGANTEAHLADLKMTMTATAATAPLRVAT